MVLVTFQSRVPPCHPALSTGSVVQLVEGEGVVEGARAAL